MIRLVITLILGMLISTAPAQVPQVNNPHGDLDLDCLLCHTADSWRLDDAAIDYDHEKTGFVLEGSHAQVRCQDCHQEPNFAFVPTQCADCHDDFHAGRLGVDCQACHDPSGWVNRPQMRRDHDQTALPLVGAHERADCDACHTGPVASFYVGTPTDCYTCHAETYESTTEPDHMTAGFGTDCATCHGVYAATWGSGDFVHSLAFPLTGEHQRIDCRECHDGGYAGTPTDCQACHQNDYDATANPDHSVASFPLDCQACHSTEAWVPASFNHDATGWPLTGAHRNTDCLSCHAAGYPGTPTDCYACHQQEYDDTNDPGHAATGFPISCEDCHTTSRWEPSTWDHEPLFPLESGPHREKWNSCTDCHLVPTDYSQFECIFCHEHNEADMWDKHKDEDDYEWVSVRCLDCHPRGRN